RRQPPRKKTPGVNEFSRENFLVQYAARSCLNLQPVFRWRQDGKRGQISADHRHLVALIKPGALVAVFVDLVGKILMSSDRESHAREKFWNASEQANAGDSVFFRLRQKSLDQASAAATALARGIDGNRTNFSQMHAIEVESAASDDAPIMLEDDKVADVLADLRQRAWQQCAVARIGRDESVNLLGIGKDRVTRAHGSPCAAPKRFSFLCARSF